METFGKIYQFGQKIGADLSFDGMRYCGLKLLDGRELKFYSDGRIVVGDYEWTPPENMLESIEADLKYARKCGLESNPEGYLEHFKTAQRLVQEYIQEIEEILAEPQREKLRNEICRVESTFQYLTEYGRALVQPHYRSLYVQCYGSGPIDLELVEREVQVIWDELGSLAENIVQERYEEDITDLLILRHLEGLEEDQA